MDEQMNSDELLKLTNRLKESYNAFEEAVKKEESKRDVGSFFQKLMGGFGTTRSDLLCDDFLEEVQRQMPRLQMALEAADPADAAEACAAVADTMLTPVGDELNSTTGLMKRAMVSLFLPLMPYLDRDKLKDFHARITGAYRKYDRLPVEEQLIRAMEQRLKDK